MAGSTFGNLFKITTWGESHGTAIGVVIDGCPAGLALNENDIQIFLDRRKSGKSVYTTPRMEQDLVSIHSGVFEGRTTGCTISLTIANKSQHSADYSNIMDCYRPGHADFTYDAKYGFRDYRGGGRSSGRETIGRVAAGAIAVKILRELGITLCAYTKSIGPIVIDYKNCSFESIYTSPFFMPDLNASAKAEEYVAALMQAKDSSGGIVECLIKGVPAGIGEPVFEKLDANLAKAVMSIGAVKGFEIGSGFEAAFLTGSQNNDGFYTGQDGKIYKNGNHSGGVLGGLSDGSEIVLRAAVKPTSSIARTQQTTTKTGRNIPLNVLGRHDAVIVPRAVVVIETMAALVITDMLFQGMASRLDRIKDFYLRPRA